MNCDKELNLTHSKSKVQWWTIFAIFGMILAFTACHKDNDSIDVEEYPSLKIMNQVSDSRYISSVRLVGYEFNNLNITSGNSQTFALDKGMAGGYENINITVSYRTPYVPSNSISTSINFNKGEITTIMLKGCISYEGCDGYYLEYNP